MKVITHAVLVVISGLAATFAVARSIEYELPPETASLRPAIGAGHDAADNNCRVCHSADYIETQPPNKGKSFWQGEVTKMINVYKAQISAEDAKIIADYLAETY